jgi:hypothetical protein
LADHHSWRYFEAVELGDQPADQADTASSAGRQRFYLWISGLAVVLFVTEDESPVFEARASNGTLRERAYPIRHQVIRLGADPVWAAERAAGPFGGRATMAGFGDLGSSLPNSIDLPSGPVALKYLAVSELRDPPSTVRVNNWSWEDYRTLNLRQTVPFARVNLPSELVGFSFNAAFLFTSSAEREAVLHVVWKSADGREMELVVGNHSEAVDEDGDDDSIRYSGRVRFADLYSAEPQVLGRAAELLGLRLLAAEEEPLPSERSPWRRNWP